MSFTYNLTASGNSLYISQIRLEIGDTDSASDAGIKPSGANFSDAELLQFYNDEGSVLAGAARACEVLARMWAGASQAVRIREYSIDTTKKTNDYNSLAKELRARSGSLFVSGSAPTMRVDGYGNDENSQETTDSSGYWRERKEIKWP